MVRGAAVRATVVEAHGYAASRDVDDAAVIAIALDRFADGERGEPDRARSARVAS